MHALLRLSSAIDRMNERIGKLVAWLGLAAVVVCTANAIARYAFNVASNAWLELQWYFNAAVFLLIAAYALRRNEHVRIDVINGRLSPRAQAWIDILGGLLMLLPGLHPGQRAKRSLVRPNDSHNDGVQPIGARACARRAMVRAIKRDRRHACNS